MEHSASKTPTLSGIGTTLSDQAKAEGSAHHRYVSSTTLNSDPEAARNLADAAHYLCVLHGAHPGVVDLAAMKTADPHARSWLEQAVQGFGRERVFLATLTAAAGPLPSTAGHSESEAAVLNQRHAIETLAASERVGCALGAAIALVLDWQAIRVVLAAAAEKLEVEVPLSLLPDRDEAIRTANAVGATPAVCRAIAFGADQILTQHRGLWDLLEAREVARDIW
jgi:hypothetical protein